MFSSATQPLPPPRQNFVSAITFEGFKLFKKINKVPYGSEMARNAIESEFRTSKMADQSEMARNAIQSDFQTSKTAAEKKPLCIDLKMARIAIKSEFRKSKMADRSEMARNAIESLMFS